MIEINYKVGSMSIEAKGHAGYAAHGQDIVCAAATALMCTLPAALMNRGIKVEYSPEPEYKLEAQPRSDQRYPCLVIMETVLDGLRLLERDYPGHIKLIVK